MLPLLLMYVSDFGGHYWRLLTYAVLRRPL